ncbi:molybdopterin synthase catalytic subunit MoaE [Chitinimonas sp.]|uniref:molybdopterin synthase catalytic subunit MoaE n=1 Tax=Chitinimonas sp. TaxID=1934313 RepID=UPI0035B394EF
MMDNSRINIAVQTQDFDLGQEYAALCAGDAGIGAVVAFAGRVRDLNLAADVVALELEHYPGMTEKALHAIATEAMVRWPLNGLRIIHRVGKLHPGEQIVLVLTASSHRHAAYEANAFVMDYLKTRAPFWKKEWTPQGPRWVDARASDHSAAERWHQVVAGRYGNEGHD